MYLPSTARPTVTFLKKIVVSTALIAVGMLSTVTQVQATETLPLTIKSPVKPTITAANSTALRSLPNGVYLYGESPQPNQIGSSYMVLQVKDRSVAGAFYMPSSSFDCFQGKIVEQRLALTVMNSEEQTRYPYSLPLQKRSLEATTQTETRALIPAGYHAIAQVSDRDRQILSTCQAATQP